MRICQKIQEATTSQDVDVMEEWLGMEMTVVQTWRLEVDSQCPPKEPGVGGHGLYT